MGQDFFLVLLVGLLGHAFFDKPSDLLGFGQMVPLGKLKYLIVHLLWDPQGDLGPIV